MNDDQTGSGKRMPELSYEQKKRQQKDAGIIVKRILNHVSSPQAVILCGGYGRGEGAWIQDRNGSPAPYNDYDIAVVSEKSISNEENEKLRASIASEIGISWIDIDWYKYKQLKHLSATIKNYDLLHAGTVIYGDKNIFQSVRDVDSRKIGEYDIVTLYKTRIWTFLGSWKGDFHNLAGDEAVFFKNQMAKAILAACDMLLVKDRLYTPSYRERVELVKDRYGCIKELENLSEWALKEKLRPSSDSISAECMEKLYWDSRRVFCQAMKAAMGDKYSYFENPCVTKRYFCRYTRYLPASLYHRFFKLSDRAEKTLDIFLAQNYVFLANERNCFNDRYIQKSCDILIKWGYMLSRSRNWTQVREAAAFARNHI